MGNILVKLDALSVGSSRKHHGQAKMITHFMYKRHENICRKPALVDSLNGGSLNSKFDIPGQNLPYLYGKRSLSEYSLRTHQTVYSQSHIQKSMGKQSIIEALTCC